MTVNHKQGYKINNRQTAWLTYVWNDVNRQLQNLFVILDVLDKT